MDLLFVLSLKGAIAPTGFFRSLDFTPNPVEMIGFGLQETAADDGGRMA